MLSIHYLCYTWWYMEYYQAVIQAIVEGITEFLPISSTGHLVLSARLMGISQTEFVKSFEIIIQLGSILAIVFLYWKTLFVQRKVWKPILIAFLPTAILGFTLYKIIKGYLIGNEMITVAALFIGGIILILIELKHKEHENALEKIEDISPKQALLIGLAQSVAMIPGVSRSAATIIGGLLLKLKRKTAVEFSFLLAVPTMISATGYDLIKTRFAFSSYEYSVLAVGFIGAFIVAIFTIKFLLKYIEKNNFIPFGIYRIVLAILFFLFVLN